MNSEDIINQYSLAFTLSESFSESNHLDVKDLLDYLATAGIKLVALTDSDYDEEGVSIVSKAYMYSVFEKIESSHFNIKNQDLSDLEDSDENFDDYIEDDIDQEDLFDED